MTKEDEKDMKISQEEQVVEKKKQQTSDEEVMRAAIKISKKYKKALVELANK